MLVGKESAFDHVNGKGAILSEIHYYIIIIIIISKCWSTPAVVVEIGPNRDYLLKTSAGRLFRRNRRMLRKRIPVMPGTKLAPTSMPPAPAPPEISPEKAKPRKSGKAKPPTFAVLRRSNWTTTPQTVTQNDVFAASF